MHNDATYQSDLMSGYASAMENAIDTANSLPAESEEAILQAQKAIFCLMARLAPSLGRHLQPAPTEDPSEVRAIWLEHLRFLNGGMDKPWLRYLSVCLEELDRGVQPPALARKPGGRQGGSATTLELQLRGWIVEGADELRRSCSKSIQYEARLKELGIQRSTVEAYRKAVKNGPSEFRPTARYVLKWPNVPPEEMIMKAISLLPKNGRKSGIVETSA